GVGDDEVVSLDREDLGGAVVGQPEVEDGAVDQVLVGVRALGRGVGVVLEVAVLVDGEHHGEVAVVVHELAGVVYGHGHRGQVVAVVPFEVGQVSAELGGVEHVGTRDSVDEVLDVGVAVTGGGVDGDGDQAASGHGELLMSSWDGGALGRTAQSAGRSGPALCGRVGAGACQDSRCIPASMVTPQSV